MNDSDDTITFDKADPQLAKMFSSCKPGDEISLTIGYEGQTATLNVTVGQDDEDRFTGTIDEVGEGTPAEEASDADEGTPGATDGDAINGDGGDVIPPKKKPAGKGAKMNPMDYVKRGPGRQVGQPYGRSQNAP